MTEVAAKKAASAGAYQRHHDGPPGVDRLKQVLRGREPPGGPAGEKTAAAFEAWSVSICRINSPVAYDASLALRPLREAVFGEGSHGEESVEALRRS